jgi:hypothetical protein
VQRVARNLPLSFHNPSLLASEIILILVVLLSFGSIFVKADDWMGMHPLVLCASLLALFNSLRVIILECLGES